MNLTGRPVYQKGQKPQKSQPIRNAARDAECQLRIEGVCSHDKAKTVLCHLRLFGMGGTSQKPDDLFAVDGCSNCHAVLDSRDKWSQHGLTYQDILRALMFTQRNRRAAGMIITK